MIEVPAQATADGSGTATVVLRAPTTSPFRISSVSLNVTPGVPIPKATAYRNVISPSTVAAARRAGDIGSLIGDPDDVLFSGQSLIVQWTGCAVGATCSAVMRGRTDPTATG